MSYEVSQPFKGNLTLNPQGRKPTTRALVASLSRCHVRSRLVREWFGIVEMERPPAS